MPFAPSKKKRSKPVARTAMLSLTSLMDMFTIILLFLLQSYSAQGDIIPPHEMLKLPLSTAESAPRLRLLIQTTTEEIIVDGRFVAGVSEAAGSEGLMIKPLYEELNRQAKKTEFIARNNPAVRFTGEVLIQGDKRIPFVLLEKVMYTCGQAGYNGISLAVITRE